MIEDERCRFWTGDVFRCLEIVESNSIDLILADPPYGSTRNKWDIVIPLEPMWAELTRVCKGPIVLTAIQPFSSLLVASRPRLFRHEWIWEKNKASGHLNCSHSPLRSHEHVLVFDGSTYNPQMTNGHAPGNFAKRAEASSNYGAQRDSSPYGGQTTRYPRSVQRFDVVNNDSPDRVHPTQKPVELMEYLVRTYSNEGDLVLDFCCGSGTTGVAAVKCGRRFLGFDLDPNYVALAKARLAAALLLP